jgi:dinuclear metal center YbgI/SA1388 family protein
VDAGCRLRGSRRGALPAEAVLRATRTISRDELVRHLDTLLEISLFEDYCPNGLQVEGRSEIRRVVTGVTSSLALIEEAIRRKADAVVVHHGIFWSGASPVLRGSMKKRVRALLEADLNLIAYHLPLDRHAEVGNNAPALRALGGVDLEPFSSHGGQPIGWCARLASPASAREFLARVESFYAAKATAFLAGPATVRTVGIVSGASQKDATRAVAAGLDCFITGEISEPNLHIAQEEGLNHISIGHHASERVGARELAAYLAKTFGLEAEFVDVPNPA